VAHCKFCGNPVSTERVEAGYAYCMVDPCLTEGMREKEPSWVVIGQHKGVNLVCAVDDPLITAKRSYYQVK